MKIARCPRCNNREFLSNNPLGYSLSRRPKNKNVKICNQCGDEEAGFDMFLAELIRLDKNSDIYSKEVIEKIKKQEQIWLNEK